MMKTSKVLININDISELDSYRKIGISNFLFAVNDYSIGYPSFALEDIPHDAYLLMNRVFDTASIEALKKDIEKIKCYKGVIFEDVGVYNIFKGLNIELIWYQNHFSINTNSINVWLSKVDSAVIANDITGSEITEILEGAKNSLIFNIFGKNQIMYSRRTLLSNFNKYQKLDNYNDMVLDVDGNDATFFARESEFGTVIYNNEYFNYIDFANTLDDEKIKFYLIMNMDCDPATIKEIIEGKKIGDDGFLNKKTVYKMADYNDR